MEESFLDSMIIGDIKRLNKLTENLEQRPLPVIERYIRAISRKKGIKDWFDYHFDQNRKDDLMVAEQILKNKRSEEEPEDKVPKYSSSHPLSKGYIFVPGKEDEGTFGFGTSPVLYYGRRRIFHSGDNLQAPYFVRLSDLEEVLSSRSNLRLQKAGQETLVRRTLTGGLVVQRKSDHDPYIGRAVFSRHETDMIKNMVQLYARN